MTYISKNEGVILDIFSSLGYLGITKQEFYNDIESYVNSYKGKKKIGNFGFKKFKQKYQSFFDFRKIRKPSSKTINSKSSLDGMIRLLTNEKHFSSNLRLNDFQDNLRNTWLNYDFLKIAKLLKYHKGFSITQHLILPKGFKSKISYRYTYKEKKIGINGFRSGNLKIDNWSKYIRDYIDYDLDIIWNNIKRNIFSQYKYKYMTGFKLYLETYENSKGIETYQDNIPIGTKTPITDSVSKLKRNIVKALRDLETNLLLPNSKSKLPKYHIYISNILFTQYEIP